MALRGQDPDKSDRSSVYNRPADRDRESERPRAPARSKDPQEITEASKKPSIYDRSTTEKYTTTTTTTEESEKETSAAQTEEPKDRSQKYSFVTSQPKFEAQPQQKISHMQHQKVQETTTDKELPQKYWKPTLAPENQNREKEEPIEDYPSEYYDDVEEPAVVPVPPPRPTVRIIKRPFLPSRGGNPNPRGLSPVGSKAPTSPRQENPIKHYIKLQSTTVSYSNEGDIKGGSQEDYQNKGRIYENKQTYNTYKNVQQPEPIQKQHQQMNDNYDTPISRPALRRPEPETPKRRPEIQDLPVLQKTTPSWMTDYSAQEQNNEAKNQGIEQQPRGNIRHPQNDNLNIYSSSYKNDDDPQEQLSINGNFKVKQKINEVTHHNLQDIPESEYDVTLNEALTPNLSQEPSLPSGFVLPLHRQFQAAGRDTILQPSENTYKFSRPLNQQQKPQQQQTQTQQNAFVPNPQFAQSSRNSDRGKTVYFRTPETIQISGSQYRQQRGHWGDYTGF